MVEALPTTSWVKLIDKKKFAKAALIENSKTFMVHISTLKVATAMLIHLLRTSQISELDKPTLAVL